MLLLQRSVRLLTPNYQSARFQSLRNSLQRVTPKITAPIKAATFSPNAGCSHSSDTPGCPRRKLGLQQVAEPDSRLLLAHPACQASGPFTTKVMRICVYVCVWSSETVSAQCHAAPQHGAMPCLPLHQVSPIHQVHHIRLCLSK